jgi:hypothetical protein
VPPRAASAVESTGGAGGVQLVVSVHSIAIASPVQNAAEPRVASVRAASPLNLAADDAGRCRMAARSEALGSAAIRGSAPDLLGMNHDLVEVVTGRTWRLLAQRWSHVCSELVRAGVPTRLIRRTKRSLEYPVFSFEWVLSKGAQLAEIQALCAQGALAVDVMWFLTQLEGKVLLEGPRMPRDLLDRYLLESALVSAGLEPAQVGAVLGNLFGRSSPGAASLGLALAAFARFRRRPRSRPTDASATDRSSADASLADASSADRTGSSEWAPLEAERESFIGEKRAAGDRRLDQESIDDWLVDSLGTGRLERAVAEEPALDEPAFEEEAVLDEEMLEVSPEERRFLPLWFAAAASVAGLVWAASAAKAIQPRVQVLAARLAEPGPRLVVSVALAMLLLVVAARRGHRFAQLLTLLLGVPLEQPFRWFGGEERALARRARWLSAFLHERPRSNNTPGAHLAYAMIAVKRSLKELALRRERADAGIVRDECARTRLVRERNRAARRVYDRLLDDPPAAAEHSRQQHGLEQELSQLSAALLARRLELQAEVIDAFERAWEQELRAGRVARGPYEKALAELKQPPGEPAALLPRGLTRGPLVWLFEYGMFFGRVAMALAFVATFQTPYLGVAILLFVLNSYVVEPVVFKMQLAALAPLCAGPGHALCDLQRHLRELPPGQVFRLPITVPKFSSNPAWTNLNAIIQAALTRSLTTAFTLVPLAMRQGRKHIDIELEDGAERDVAARATALCDALRVELEAARARFPLATRVSIEGRRVTLELTDEDEQVWALIGEDASQAIIYLWRNLHALRDTLSHLGQRFRPVFILASNTEDPDVVEFEVAELRKLQAWSDEHYAGQVGFLYLLRGGQWCNYGARNTPFDAKDKTFARAVNHFKQRLVDPATPAREHLLGTLIAALEPQQLAAAFNTTLRDESFYEAFAGFQFDALPPHAALADETLRLLARKRSGERLAPAELALLNRELLLTALPMQVSGAFFKKVGNDIAVQELLVAGKTRPTTYVDRRVQEHVQDPTLPNYARVWGDFARYTGLSGSSEQIQNAILRGADLSVESVPELGAILDDKNEFAPGEIEKGLATLLHPSNRHIVIGVPRIDVTLPEQGGEAVASEFILAGQAARAAHNASDALARTRLFSFSTPAYGKWFTRPAPYLAHYTRESLNAAHSLSHDFQQSYLVAGAGGRLGGFTEALYGPTRFEVRAAPEPSSGEARAAGIGALCRRWMGLLLARERVR